MAKHKTFFEDCDILVVGGGMANLNPSGATGFGVRLLNQLIDKYYE